MSKLIEKIESEQFKQVAPFNIGDSVRVHTRVKEGEKERTQIFEGTVIARKGRGLNEMFTVRKLSYGEGVERIFPVHSPRLEKVEVKRPGSVRRAKLYYLRGRKGKEALAALASIDSMKRESSNATPRRRGGGPSPAPAPDPPRGDPPPRFFPASASSRRSASSSARASAPSRGSTRPGAAPWPGPSSPPPSSCPPISPIPGSTTRRRSPPERRAEAAGALRSHPEVRFAIAEASVEEIDALNILRASLLAMRRAVAALALLRAPDYVLVDGRDCPPVGIPGNGCGEGRREGGLHRRRLDPCQGKPGCHDAGVGQGPPPVWLRRPQGIRDPAAPRRPRRARPLPASSALFRALRWRRTAGRHPPLRRTPPPAPTASGSPPGFSRREGLKVLLRNVRTEEGEIDLVCREGAVLAFVEVKARRDSRFGEPSQAVDAAKRARLVRAAQLYLRELRQPRIDYRFDIAEVFLREREIPACRLIRDRVRGAPEGLIPPQGTTSTGVPILTMRISASAFQLARRKQPWEPVREIASGSGVP